MKAQSLVHIKNIIKALSTYRMAAIAGPLVFGIISLLLGADTNWDLQNYHLYNAFALLNGKLDIDLAPAGFQTYFNPMLDVPYFLAMQHLPPPFVGFLMGALHGFNFVLLLGICRISLPKLRERERLYIPTLLALAGCLTANFLSELGSTMGDNSTALFCLGSILLALVSQKKFDDSKFSGLMSLFAAGLLMGIAVGLKLTNAPYAVAICLSLFVFHHTWLTRLKLAFLFGIGVLAGIGLMNGYWFYTMWLKFGNPLFPQFNNLFQNPIAASVAVGDTSWLPKNLWQQIFWPFIISVDAQKVGQIAIRQIIWALIYLALIVFLLKAVYFKLAKRASEKFDPEERFVLGILIFGFFVWMKLFSIYRYLVPLDLLAPLGLFILCKAILPYVPAKRVAGFSIVVATLVVFSGTRTWWHEPWSENLLHAEVPALANPDRTTVLMLEGDPPWAWLAIKFPVNVAFVQIQGNFPQGPAYSELVKQTLLKRNGPTFAQFSGVWDDATEKADRIRHQAEWLGLTKNESRCELLGKFVEKLRLRASVVPADKQSGVGCRLEVKSKHSKRDIDLEIRTERNKARDALEKYGLTFADESCELYRAGIASDVRVYQWCPVTSIGNH